MTTYTSQYASKWRERNTEYYANWLKLNPSYKKAYGMVDSDKGVKERHELLAIRERNREAGLHRETLIVDDEMSEML